MTHRGKTGFITALIFLFGIGILCLTLVTDSAISDEQSFQIIRPQMGQLQYPDPEIREDIEADVYATLEFELSVSSEGKLLAATVVKHTNIPVDLIEKYSTYFRTQLEKMTIIPAFQKGKPISSLWEYPIQWQIFQPPQTLIPVTSLEDRKRLLESILTRNSSREKNRKVSNQVITPEGKEITIKEYRQNIEAKAWNLLESEKSQLKFLTGDTLTRREQNITLISNSYSQETLDQCMKSVVATHATFFKVFKKIIPPKLTMHPVKLYLFRDYETYLQFKESFSPLKWVHACHFGQIGIMSSYLKRTHRLNLREAIVHETVHYLNFEILFPLWHPPRWLDEGLAEYFASSYIDERGLMNMGTIDYKKYTHSLQRSWQSTGNNDMAFIKEQQDIFEGNIVENLVRGKISYNNDSTLHEVRLFYASSYVLTHYLIGLKKKGPADSFYDFVADIRTGEDPVSSLQKHYGDLAEIERKLWQHIARL